LGNVDGSRQPGGGTDGQEISPSSSPSLLCSDTVPSEGDTGGASARGVMALLGVGGELGSESVLALGIRMGIVVVGEEGGKLRGREKEAWESTSRHFFAWSKG
jgi:hypothetical protein